MLPCKFDFIYFNAFITCVCGTELLLRKTYGSLFSPFMWIPAIERRSSGVGSKCLYLLSHFYSPAKLISEAITRIVEKNANICA